MPSATFSGAGPMATRLKKAQQEAPNEFGRALLVETKIEAEEVRRRIPYRFGWLRESTRVAGWFRGGKRIWAAILVGGPQAPYAIFVERRVALHSQGQAYFLGSVIEEGRRWMMGRVAARIDLNRLG